MQLEKSGLLLTGLEPSNAEIKLSHVHFKGSFGVMVGLGRKRKLKKGPVSIKMRATKTVRKSHG